MGETQFLLINIAVVILLLFLFLRNNKKQLPSRLSLASTKLPKVAGHKVTGGQASTSQERNLNCLFQYNGHTWDAHEVLGVPAGCPGLSITEGYESAIRKAKDEQSKSFLNAAYQALKQQGQI